MNDVSTAPVDPDISLLIAKELNLSAKSVLAIIGLLDEGATVPFIARYRKEATGGAEDFQIHEVMERLQFHREFLTRRTFILETIAGQEKLTPELQASIEAATTLLELEDLYLPYRPKRRTRATIAKEKGLEPLAAQMWEQHDLSGDIHEIAAAFVDTESGAETSEEALQGARDIVAERVAETAEWRKEIRDLTWSHGQVIVRVARGKEDEASKFSDYYEYAERVSRIPSHRILAILRGEAEGFLMHRILPDVDDAKSLLKRRVLQRTPSIWNDQLEKATEDAYDRMLTYQIATEIRFDLRLRAEREAIDVFATNLRELLMASPFGTKSVLAVDPGFRTGCKTVVLSETGRLLDDGVVFPTEPRRDVKGTEAAFDRWFKAHPGIRAIAIGNGTGGRETLAVVQNWVKDRKLDLEVVLVNESGASVYSASPVAREEFPNHDVTVRGAASIGRRLQDPLAELVKIDPKSIGVGQYQHDVDQRQLKEKLGDVVVSCVNKVGVDANTASASLLSHVSGFGPKLAQSLVSYRDEQGPFADRMALKKVPGLGAKTFEQAAGFLRVRGDNPLDNSAVHPERYALVQQMAKESGTSVPSLMGDAQSIETIRVEQYVSDDTGRFTLEDILSELRKPGLDPRDSFETVEYRDDVQKMEDLTEGMVLNGIVTNVTHFGAFVDVGVHQDGLVHVSQIADRFIQNPAEELHVGQTVRTKVLEVDLDRKRISLSIKQA